MQGSSFHSVMTRWFMVVVVVVWWSGGVQGFQFGAPTSPWVCEELLPWHGGVTDGAGILPVQLTEDGQGVYQPGEQLVLTLERNDHLEFRGFVLQGRDSTGTPVGYFVPDFSTNTICPDDEGLGTTLTHADNTDKQLIHAYWVAPQKTVGPVTFHATIVQEYNPTAGSAGTGVTIMWGPVQALVVYPEGQQPGPSAVLEEEDDEPLNPAADGEGVGAENEEETASEVNDNGEDDSEAGDETVNGDDEGEQNGDDDSGNGDEGDGDIDNEEEEPEEEEEEEEEEYGADDDDDDDGDDDGDDGDDDDDDDGDDYDDDGDDDDDDGDDDDDDADDDTGDEDDSVDSDDGDSDSNSDNSSQEADDNDENQINSKANQAVNTAGNSLKNDLTDSDIDVNTDQAPDENTESEGLILSSTSS